MKNIWQILTLLLAVALVAMTVKTTFMKPEETPAPQVEAVDPSEVIYNNIMTRSSVRSYTDQEVDKATIEKLLKAGMAAPTAGNKQPWELMVINDRAILDAFPPIISGAHMAAKAKLAIVVLGTPSKALIPDYWVQDCSAVTENILLAAHGFGLGAVWCGAYPENGSGRVEKMSELLSLPEGTLALSVIVIGYPDGESTPKDKWDPAKVHYNKY